MTILFLCLLSILSDVATFQRSGNQTERNHVEQARSIGAVFEVGIKLQSVMKYNKGESLPCLFLSRYLLYMMSMCMLCSSVSFSS